MEKQELDDNLELEVNISVNEVNVILAALDACHQSHVVVRELVAKLHKQGVEQITAAQQKLAAATATAKETLSDASNDLANITSQFTSDVINTGSNVKDGFGNLVDNITHNLSDDHTTE